MYEEILKANPTCALVGSRALILQGFKVRREPKDIDIYDPENVFKIVPGMTLPEPKENQTEEEKYNDEDGNNEHNRTSYLYKGVSVDVFSPTDKDNNKQKIVSVKVDGKSVKCIDYLETLKAKLSYIKEGGKSKGKHKMDLMYFLLMN